MARPKKPTIELKSIDDCDAALYRLLLETLQREKLEAERDAEVAKIQRSYEFRLDKAAAEIADLEAQLQQYYMAHLDQVEKEGKKSVQLNYGLLGRRMSPPALKLLNKSWSWGTVLVKLREKFGAKFIRTRDPEVDKEAVKAEIPADKLKDFGMKLDQEETFYYELNRLKAQE